MAVTRDDSSQGAELYDGFIAATVAEAITEDAAWRCWHASRHQGDARGQSGVRHQHPWDSLA
jgi:hypothetical protein